MSYKNSFHFDKKVLVLYIFDFYQTIYSIDFKWCNFV